MATGATEKDEIMSRLGPEDLLIPMQTDNNSSEFRTAGPDWVVGMANNIPLDALHYKDVEEQRRLTSQVYSSGPAGDILRDLISQRNICTKQVYLHELCSKNYKAHQQKQCTPTMVEYVKCGTKLARAVDILCRKPFWDYHACLTAHGKGSKECMASWTTFDQCTEDF